MDLSDGPDDSQGIVVEDNRKLFVVSRSSLSSGEKDRTFVFRLRS